MEIFFLSFGIVVIMVIGMAIGIMFKRKPIQGSCGGLNAIDDSDHCVVCKRPHDPDSCYQKTLKKRLSETLKT